MLAKVSVYHNTQYWQSNGEKCTFRHHPLENRAVSENYLANVSKALKYLGINWYSFILNVEIALSGKDFITAVFVKAKFGSHLNGPL